MRPKKNMLLASTTALALSGTMAFAACPPATVADMKGLVPAYPQQFELAEFQSAASCTLDLAENPAMAELNARIAGNPNLPPVAERLPEEPLVVAPYTAIGQHGGTLTGVSRATESGTSDLLSVRHVNLVRYSDDLKTIVPNVAKAWSWNGDFTQLSFTLRKGHKWSDGAPFTAHDVVFWYDDILTNPAITEQTPGRWLFGGEPARVEAVDDVTVSFTFPTPQPNLINRWAMDYGQTFLPRHFLGRFMDKYNDGAAALRAEHGFASEKDAVDFYYGASDWKDVPSPLLKDPAKAASIGVAVKPTLESHILVAEDSNGRRLVANPYFHMVDTGGNQLPYISEIREEYVPERDVVNLKVMNGEISWKQQAIELNDFPLLKENEAKGNYTVSLAPTLGETVYYSFARNHKDPVLRDIFNDPRFSQAMSMGLDREEIREIVYLGQGTPAQAIPVEAKTVDFVPDYALTQFLEHDVAAANALLDEMGLARNSSGKRQRPDGRPLAIRILFASQGSPVQLHELSRGMWEDLGLTVDLREVTSDEYRASANANDVDVFIWKNDGISGPFIAQDATMLVPPFGDFFNPGGGFEWAKWKETGGAEGIKPPADIQKLWDLSEQFLSVPLGTPESSKIGEEIVRIHADQMLKIGIVGEIPSPYVHHNSLQNVQPLTSKTYDYYWTSPYRSHQWFIAN
ncbi:MAG: ABC transporter substrate-binding protein [Roseovarius sp.]|nr:ABC transporter substrate-binding protein [Roseovarius sp.]